MLNSSFKDIKGYEGIYYIDMCGTIRNNVKEMRTYLINSGYKCIDLRDSEGVKRKWLVHRLVALNFLEEVSGCNVVNHIDGDKLNNHVDNLEWVTHQQNRDHAKDSGIWVYNKPTKGLKLGQSSKYRYVCWDKARSKWSAYLRVNGKAVGRKRFDSEDDAGLHVNYLIEKYGSDVPLNKIT